jgi:hypothetical protein
MTQVDLGTPELGCRATPPQPIDPGELVAARGLHGHAATGRDGPRVVH